MKTLEASSQFQYIRHKLRRRQVPESLRPGIEVNFEQDLTLDWAMTKVTKMNIAPIGRYFLPWASAAIMAACASAPSSHQHFSISAFDPAQASIWNMAGLPSHGSITMKANTSDETARERVAHVVIGSGEGKYGFPLLEIQMEDPGCVGAYSFQINFRSDSDASNSLYFERTLQWGHELDLWMEWKSDGSVVLNIDGVGTKSFRLNRAIHDLQFETRKGGLDVADLDFRNLTD